MRVDEISKITIIVAFELRERGEDKSEHESGCLDFLILRENGR